MSLKIQIYALIHMQRKMTLIWSETVKNMALWHFKEVKCLECY